MNNIYKHFDEYNPNKKHKTLIIFDDMIAFMLSKIRDEKLQYDINREAAKISALSSGEIDKYEYLTGEEILPSDQRRVIEQAKFTYSHLGKTLKKQAKAIENQDKKQIKAIDNHGKQLLESNELIQKDFNIDRDIIPHEEAIKNI